MEEVKNEESETFQELFHDRIRMTRQLQYIEANILSAETLGRKVGVNIDRRASVANNDPSFDKLTGAKMQKSHSVVIPKNERSLDELK